MSDNTNLNHDVQELSLEESETVQGGSFGRGPIMGIMPVKPGIPGKLLPSKPPMGIIKPVNPILDHTPIKGAPRPPFRGK